MPPMQIIREESRLKDEFGNGWNPLIKMGVEKDWPWEMGQELDEKDVMRSEDESKRDSERVGL
jgi:hypothetical protein